MELVERVNRIIEEFLAPIGGPVKISCGLSFTYCEDDNEITWSFLTCERQDRNFNKLFEEELNCHMCNFIYSLFHEYGHKMTLSSFDSEAHLSYREAKEQISELDSADERDIVYFHLPLEMAASRWAAEYINANWQKVADWACEVLTPAIDEFMSNSDAVDEISDILEEEEYYENLA